jgi:hypothetical protein
MSEGELQKCCCRCGDVKSEAEFNFKNRAIGRRHPFCRECQHTWNREHYRRNRATYIANAKRNTAAYNAERVKQLLEAEIAKCDVRCANCHQRRTATQFRWRKIALIQQGR